MRLVSAPALAVASRMHPDFIFILQRLKLFQTKLALQSQGKGLALRWGRAWLRLMRCAQEVQYTLGGSNVSRVCPHAAHALSSCQLGSSLAAPAALPPLAGAACAVRRLSRCRLISSCVIASTRLVPWLLPCARPNTKLKLPIS